MKKELLDCLDKLYLAGIIDYSEHIAYRIKVQSNNSDKPSEAETIGSNEQTKEVCDICGKPVHPSYNLCFNHLINNVPKPPKQTDWMR